MFSKLRAKPKPATPAEEAALLSELRALLPTLPAYQTNPALQSWADDATLTRYLRARDHDVGRALGMLDASLRWRAAGRVHEYLPAAGSAAEAVVRAEAASGKMFVLPGRARGGRPVVVMRPGLENSADPDANMAYLVYTLERASAMCAGGGDGKFVVIVDYAAGDFSLRRAPSLATSKRTLAIMQDHFPERLGQSILVDSPGFLNTLFRVLRPFMDARTAAKLHFVAGSDMGGDAVCQAALDPATTPAEYGGKVEYAFDADEYFRET